MRGRSRRHTRRSNATVNSLRSCNDRPAYRLCNKRKNNPRMLWVAGILPDPDWSSALAPVCVGGGSCWWGWVRGVWIMWLTSYRGVTGWNEWQSCNDDCNSWEGLRVVTEDTVMCVCTITIRAIENPPVKKLYIIIPQDWFSCRQTANKLCFFQHPWIFFS